MTYALRVARDVAASALPARIARIITMTALAALGLSREPFHEPFHAQGLVLLHEDGSAYHSDTVTDCSSSLRSLRTFPHQAA